MNTKRRILSFSVLCFLVLNLNSCEIPFKSFTTEDKENIESIRNKDYYKEVSKTFIDIKEEISFDEAYALKEKVVSIFSVIGDKNFYDSVKTDDKDKFYDPIKSYFEDSFVEEIKNGTKEDILKNVVEDIYTEENQKFKEIRLTAVGRDYEHKKAMIEVVSINDSKEFQISKIEFSFNKDNLIENINVISDMSSYKNTTKEILEDSLIDKSNEEFNAAFNEFISNFKNEKIYSLKLDESSKSEFDYELSALIDNLSLKNKDDNTLEEFFISGRGGFENYGFVEYMHYDKDAYAITYYKIRFVLDEESKDFTIKYNRLDKTIEEIE